jgi:hypothetical protein
MPNWTGMILFFFVTSDGRRLPLKEWNATSHRDGWSSEQNKSQS